VVVAWRRGPRTGLVDRFIRTAIEVRDRESEIIAAIERPFDAASGKHLG